MRRRSRDSTQTSKTMRTQIRIDLTVDEFHEMVDRAIRDKLRYETPSLYDFEFKSVMWADSMAKVEYTQKPEPPPEPTPEPAVSQPTEPAKEF